MEKLRNTLGGSEEYFISIAMILQGDFNCITRTTFRSPSEDDSLGGNPQLPSGASGGGGFPIPASRGD